MSWINDGGDQVWMRTEPRLDAFGVDLEACRRGFVLVVDIIRVD